MTILEDFLVATLNYDRMIIDRVTRRNYVELLTLYGMESRFSVLNDFIVTTNRYIEDFNDQHEEIAELVENELEVAKKKFIIEYGGNSLTRLGYRVMIDSTLTEIRDFHLSHISIDRKSGIMRIHNDIGSDTYDFKIIDGKIHFFKSDCLY